MNYPTKPSYKEELYADIEGGIWYVFGTESGHAYASFFTQDEAEEYAERLNR